MRVEEVADSGLTILRGRIDPVLADDFQEEWLRELADLANRRSLQEAGAGVFTMINDIEYTDQSSASGRLFQVLGLSRGGLLLAIN